MPGISGLQLCVLELTLGQEVWLELQLEVRCWHTRKVCASMKQSPGTGTEGKKGLRARETPLVEPLFDSGKEAPA